MMPEEARCLALECQDYLHEILCLDELLNLAIEQIDSLSGKELTRLRLLIESYRAMLTYPTDELNLRLRMIVQQCSRSGSSNQIEESHTPPLPPTC